MARAFPRTATAATALLILAQPLSALTAQEAWQGWQDMADAFGQEVTTEAETTQGDRLTVTGATFTARPQDEDGDAVTITYTVPQIVFDGQGDGAVRITLSESYDILVSGRNEEDEAVAGTMTLSHPGLEVLAQDSAEGLRFTYGAEAISLVSGAFLEDGEALALSFALGSGPVSGSYTIAGDSDIDASFDGTDLTLSLSGEDDSDGSVQVEMSMARLGVTSDSSGGTLFGGLELPELLAQGFTSDIRTEMAGLSFDMSFDGGPQDSGEIALTMGASGAETSISPQALSYTGRNSAVTLEISGSDIPVASLGMALEATALTVEMPLVQTETPEPFALRLGLEGLAVNDSLWNLFDPAGVLPRDPAALVIGLSGAGRWLVDISDPEAEDVDEPAEITRLDIGQILLSAAGAQLTAEGGFSFDYDDRDRFDGMPRPEGRLDIVLTGANRLLDRLVQMGLLQPEEAMTARMMSGMLLRPGEGPDTLISEIAVTPSGQVTANGAPLPF